MKEREHLWNIISYMLVYLLLGFVVGFGIGNLFVLVGLGLLSYGLNRYMLGKLDLSALGIVEVKKRFFVLTWKWFYINLLFTVLLTMVIGAIVYLIFDLDAPEIGKYLGAIWLLLFINANNIYEVTFQIDTSDPDLLEELHENRITGKVRFVWQQENRIVCYATYTGMKALSTWKRSTKQ